MPKLKPLRKDEEIAAVPVTEPVLVELGPSPEAAKDEREDAQAPVRATQDDTQPEEPGVKQLKDQLEAAKAADKQRQEAVARAEKERDDARKLAEERATELQASRSEREQAISDSIANSLAGAQAEQEAAEAELAKAYQAEDPQAMAKAQGKIARAAAKVLNYEAAVAELSERKERLAEEAKRKPAEQQQQQPIDIATAVQANPNLLPKEKEWLLAHQDLLVDRARGIELEAAYIRATRAGHVRGSENYFKFLDRELGYTQPNGHDRQDESRDNQDDNQGSTIMNAPVSRDTVSVSTGRASASRVTLSPEQRALAKSMGLSEVKYAEQVLKLQQDKRENPEKYASRG